MTHDNRNRAARAAAGLLAVALVIALANVLFNTLVLPHVELPDLPLPDLPGGVAFLLGTGKLIVLAVIVVLAVIGKEAARRHKGEGV